MNRSFSRSVLIALALLSSGSAIGQERPPRPDRADRPIPGRARADPGKVAATDIAFARAARDNGQWSAFRQYAAPGAQLHGADGPFDAAAWLLARADPAQSVRWAPTAVWSSCDGSLAVSFGRSRQADGTVGSYVTVWQREGRGRSGEYQWIYDTGTPDNPQPAPAPGAPRAGDIVVTELNTIQARTADCISPTGLPEDGLSARSTAAQTGGGAARDGTLRWRWDHHAPGQWRVVVDWLREGVWQEALAFNVPDS